MATSLLTVRVKSTQAAIATDIQTSLAANSVATDKLVALSITAVSADCVVAVYVYYE